MSFAEIVSMVPDWLAVTGGHEVSVGLPREVALRRAAVLRRLLEENKVSPEGAALDEDLKAVFYALVALVTEIEPRGNEVCAAETNSVYQFIARVEWPDDDLGERRALLAQCAEGGWRALGTSLAEVEQLRMTRQGLHQTIHDFSVDPNSPLDTTPTDRSEEFVDAALSNADVLFAIGAVLRDRRESDPSSVATESEAIYRWLSGHSDDVGLFDERDYLLGDFAYLAGGANRVLGKREVAFRWLDRAEAAFRHTVNPGPGLANVAYTRLALRHEMGRFEDVLELLPSLVSSFEKLGMLPEIVKARFLEGETLKKCNRISEAYALVSETRQQYKERIDVGLDGQILMWLGECQALQGRSGDALLTYQEAIPLLQRSNRKINLAHLHVLLGEMLRGENQLSAALVSYRAGQQEYGALGMGTWVAYLRVLVAETLLALDRPREAEWEILQALPTIEEQKMVPEGFAAVGLLRESVKRRRADPNALRELREHLQKQN